MSVPRHLKIWNNTVSELFNILFYRSALVFNKFYLLLIVVHAVATRKINNNTIILIIPAGLCRVLINGSDGGDMEQLLPLKVISLPQHIPFQEEGACHTSKSTPRSSMFFSGQKAVKEKTNSHPQLSCVEKARKRRDFGLSSLNNPVRFGASTGCTVSCLVSYVDVGKGLALCLRLWENLLGLWIVNERLVLGEPFASTKMFSLIDVLFLFR